MACYCLGGEGKIGKVIDIRGWDNESRRSVANVMWASGSTNVYRLGHKGKVDLKYVVDAPGYFYYRDHLPVLGQTDPLPKPGGHASSSCLTNSGGSNSHSLFNVGDKVQVVVADVNELKALQEGHGGTEMKKLKQCSIMYCFFIRLEPTHGRIYRSDRHCSQSH